LVAVIFIGAPWILTIFGKNYSTEGTALLRWLSLSAVPNVIVVLALGLARVQNRPVLIAAIQGLLCVIALLLTYILLPMFGITGAGIAWTLSQTAVGLLIGVWLLRPLFQVTRKDGHHDF
jgi:O-antigen/teichoic acid export membrane protein